MKNNMNKEFQFKPFTERHEAVKLITIIIPLYNIFARKEGFIVRV
jgi:hypothetical protein